MAVALVAAIAIMQLTAPATIHPIGLLVFFLCLYVFMLGLIAYMVYFGQSLLKRYFFKRQPALTFWRSTQLASVAALAPIMLLAMRTVSTVTVLDVMFVGLFVAVALFYVIKRG